MSNWFTRLLKAALPFSIHPRGLLTSEVIHHTNLVVADGPFKGMRYIDSSIGSELVPKLLGLYERELTPVVEQLIAMKPGAVVDIGAAEGYFVVGLARRLTGTRVVAYEMELAGREKIAELARRNSVQDRIEIRDKCEPELLRQAIDELKDCAVICDVEGYEKLLLDPVAIPALSGVPILVEVHEFMVAGIGAELKSRFAASHAITEIAAEHRTVAEYPYSSLRRKLIPNRFVEFIVNESRPAGMSWLWMVPISKNRSEETGS